jgi:hypothetical protein
MVTYCMQRAGDQTAVTDSKTGGENTTTTVCLCESTLHIQANSLQEPFAFYKQTGYMDVDEERACSAFATDSSGLISNLDLLSPDIPTETILCQVTTVFPRLSGKNADIATFTTKLQCYVKDARPFTITDRQPSPTTWPSTNDEMDEIWQQAVNREAQLHLGSLPQGISMHPRYLVKPVGSLQAPVAVLCSYPTLDANSAVQLDFATIDDISNQSSFTLYCKLGYNKLNIQATELLHLDVFPRRLNRKQIFGPATSVLSKVPQALTQYWESHTDMLLKMAAAPVAIVAGHTALQYYEKYLRRNEVRHETIWLTGVKGSDSEI